MQLQDLHLDHRGTSENTDMASAKITRKDFLEDRQGKTFADVANDAEYPFDATLEFFSDPDRQRRMEESETHHDRAPLAGVVRELESLAPINDFLSTFHAQRSQRLRQAIGVLVRMIMERRGWQQVGQERLARRPQCARRADAKSQSRRAGILVRARRALRTERGHAVPHGARPLQGI